MPLKKGSSRKTISSNAALKSGGGRIANLGSYAHPPKRKRKKGA